MKYTYPKGHPKEGKTTTVRGTVWQCPICNYTSNLADDIKEHRARHREEHNQAEHRVAA